MKGSKKLAALALCAMLSLGLVGLTACDDMAGKSAYDLWLEQGNTGTVQEFLASLKGEKGDKNDQGLPGEGGKNGSNGENGLTPQIEIDDDGYWVIDGERTDVKAAGENGSDGAPGSNGSNGRDGNTWIVKDGVPDNSADGKDGDLCLDKSEWNVYHKEGGVWQLLGCIKGKDGVASDEGDATYTRSVSLNKDTPAEIDISELSVGFHLIYIDLGDQKLSDQTGANVNEYTGGRIQVVAGESGKKCELSECEDRSEDETKYVYYGFLIKKEGDTSAKISLLNEKTKTFEATVTVEDYVTPTLKADDKQIIVPINQHATEKQSLYKFNIDSSMVDGTYTMSLESNSIRSVNVVSIGMFGKVVVNKIASFELPLNFSRQSSGPATYRSWQDITANFSSETNVITDDKTGYLYGSDGTMANGDCIFIGKLSMTAQ